MREIVKLAAAAAIILIAAVLIGLFASGYISAFKPGGANETAGGHVIGGGNTVRGGISAISTPTLSPSPAPGPQATGAMPATAMQPPYPQGPSAQPIPPVQEPYGPAMPSIQPPLSPLTPAPGIPGPIGIPGGPEALPGAGPAVSPMPSIGQPASTPSPFVLGWMQIIQRFVTILPYLFPGISPFYSWWPPGL